MNRQERKAYGAAYRATNRGKIRVKKRLHYAAHKEEYAVRASAFYKTHKKEVARRNKAYRETCRDLEMVIIAQRWGDDIPRCRFDLTPGLSSIQCIGALQIDHINGNPGGQQHREKSIDRTLGVINDIRALDDLRILCEQHQWSYAILKGNSIGGSRLEDWEKQ